MEVKVNTIPISMIGLKVPAAVCMHETLLDVNTVYNIPDCMKSTFQEMKANSIPVHTTGFLSDWIVSMDSMFQEV